MSTKNPVEAPKKIGFAEKSFNFNDTKNGITASDEKKRKKSLILKSGFKNSSFKFEKSKFLIPPTKQIAIIKAPIIATKRQYL